MALSPDQIEDRFGFHKAAIEGPNAKAEKHAQLRVDFKAVASLLNDRMPEGRYKSLMMTSLEEASMWAHKALANE